MSWLTMDVDNCIHAYCHDASSVVEARALTRAPPRHSDWEYSRHLRHQTRMEMMMATQGCASIL